jgi:dipeptidase E
VPTGREYSHKVAGGHIVAMGGAGLGTARDDYLLGLARGRRICFVPTASSEDDNYVIRFYETFAAKAEATHLSFFPWPPSDLRAFLLEQDVIYVGGGNTANMLAVWRVHGMESALREAWEAGIVLCGSSAGMICWFEAGLTDSFGPELEGMRDGLGFLPGSACPHYDGEELRRPRFRELVDGGFPPGWAADDAVGIHFEGTEVAEVVTADPGKRAYRVEPGSEEPREARTL